MNSIMLFLVFLLAASLYEPDLSAKAERSHIGSDRDDRDAQQEQKDQLLQPNVTVDLSPPPGKMVIPEKPRPAKNEQDANIFLNFENASLTSVLDYLAEQKKINVLPDKSLSDHKVTLSTRMPLTLDRAWNILLTLLDLSKFTINQVGDLYRVVPRDNNGKEPLPFYFSKTTEIQDIPDTNEIIRYFYFLSNLKIDFVKTILPAILEGGEDKFIALDDLQAFIVKEKGTSIKAAMKIIKELDIGGIRESIKIITLQEASADEVAKKLEEIIGSADKDRTMRFTAVSKKKETTYFSSSTKIIPYPIKNALVLLGVEKNINRVVDFVYKYLDVPIGSAKSRLHIKEIRYISEASSVAQLVRDMIKPPGQTADKSVMVGKYKFFEDVIIQDEPNAEGGRASGNRLIISCNDEDWVRIEEFIDSIDKPQPQIALEFMIVNLTESQTKDLGAQMQTKGNLGMGINQGIFSNLSPGPGTEAADIIERPEGSTETSNPMQNYMNLISKGLLNNGAAVTLGGTNNVWAIIQAQLAIQSSQVIGQPYLVANNNAKNGCELSLQETRRLPGPLVNKDGSPQMATIKDEKAGTTLKIEPKVNSDGIVDLNITMDVNRFELPITDQSDVNNTKITRSIVTKASMLAGEVLVFGGFKSSNLNVITYKTPILGDIPLVGNLFKRRQKEKTETYLYVFVRPSIIKPSFDGNMDEYSQLKVDFAKYQIMKNDVYARSKDPIQRWFFKPSNYSVKQKIEEARLGIVAPVDDFVLGKSRPRAANIKGDTYFNDTEAVEKHKHKLKERKNSEKIAAPVEVEKSKVTELANVESEKKPQAASRLASFAQAYEKAGTNPNG